MSQVMKQRISLRKDSDGLLLLPRLDIRKSGLLLHFILLV